MTKEQLQELTQALNNGQKHGSGIAFVRELNRRFAKELGRDESLIAESKTNKNQSVTMSKYLSGERPISPAVEFCIRVLFRKEIKEYGIKFE